MKASARRSVLVILGTAAALLQWVTPSSVNASPTVGGTLVVAQSADPTSLDPYRYGSTNDRSIISTVARWVIE